MLEIKPASTVVLCRNSADWPPELLLLKRSPQALFLANAHVFPGGSLKACDYAEAPSYEVDLKHIKRMASYFPFSSFIIAAHLAKALREAKKAAIFFEPQKPDLSHIWPLSWWVTPKSEPCRFDTWFFLAALLEHQVPKSFSKDIAHKNPLWLKPAQALLCHEEGSIFLAPPTRAILERIAHSQSLEELLTFIDCPLKPIYPYFINYKHQKLLVVPKKSRFIMKSSYVF
jgi:hypothetical protein